MSDTGPSRSARTWCCRWVSLTRFRSNHLRASRWRSRATTGSWSAGSDKETVGETAARIRRVKVPEPYKGKGIKYQGERVRSKAGKTGGKKK